jgi:RNase adaptor protein for sRNA GlmZ degradation
MSTINTEDDLFLMVNVRGRSSGLPMNIWVGPRGRARHAARIKVQMDHREQFDIDNLAVVSVEDDPPEVKAGHLDAADLDLVRRYIALNRQAILDHWQETTDGVELSRALRALR